jgi:hypothetical protein
VFGPLGLETVEDAPDFSRDDNIVQENKEIGITEIPVKFWNLILQNQMISKCIPRQLRDQPMILMQVISIMRENDIRRKFLFEILEIFFYFGTLEREEAHPVVSRYYGALCRILEKKASALSGLKPPLSFRTEDDPPKMTLPIILHETK